MFNIGALVGCQVQMVLEGHNSWVYNVAISTDGDKIVSTNGDKTVRVWSAETGEVLASVCDCSRVLACFLLNVSQSAIESFGHNW